MKATAKGLFVTFFKIGAFTFGGGYAMIPLIKREVVEEKEWLTNDEMFDIVAIAESTPGPLAINAATFVGTKTAGIKGALCATLGVVLPSFAVILLISSLLLQMEHLKIIQDAFRGIRTGVLVLVASALFSMFRQLKKNTSTYLILLLALVLALVLKLNSSIVLTVCALCGMAWSYYCGRKVEK